MTDQLLWFETLLKGGIGLVMLFTPLTAAKLAGLPHGNTAFWPRLFGTALLAIAAAFAFQGYTHLNTNVSATGIGLGGAVIINFVSVLSLIGTIVLGGVSTRRGLLLVWSMCLILLFLALFEIAHA